MGRQDPSKPTGWFVVPVRTGNGVDSRVRYQIVAVYEAYASPYTKVLEDGIVDLPTAMKRHKFWRHRS